MKNEKEFSAFVKRRFTEYGYIVYGIESAMTANGIPDLFVMGGGDDVWIELKFSKKEIAANSFRVDWRPGQQAFAKEYRDRHTAGSWCGSVPCVKTKCTFTVFMSGTKVYVIRMDKVYVDNIATVDNQSVHALQVCTNWFETLISIINKEKYIVKYYEGE